MHYLNPPSKLGLNGSIGIKASRFSYGLSLEPTPLHVMPTLISKIKALTLFECKHKVCYSMFFLFFIDVSEDPIMVNDATMSSNPLVALLWNEKFD